MRARTIGALSLVLAAGLACDERPKGRGSGNSPVILPGPAKIVVEAESGEVRPPFETAEDAAASGERCVVLPEVWATHEELNPAHKTREGGEPVFKTTLPRGEALVPNGMIVLPFEVKKKARYACHVRAWFHCECGDSFYLSLDREPPVDTDGNGEYDENAPDVIGGSTRQRWKWFPLRGREFELEEGTHVARIFPREDGVKIDQLLLVEIVEGWGDPYVPQGKEASRR
jgi:hypothetical protein